MENHKYRFSALRASHAPGKPGLPSASGSILVVCKVTGERLPFNEAARAGWAADLNGEAFNAYYSPAGIQIARGLQGAGPLRLPPSPHHQPWALI